MMGNVRGFGARRPTEYRLGSATLPHIEKPSIDCPRQALPSIHGRPEAQHAWDVQSGTRTILAYSISDSALFWN